MGDYISREAALNELDKLMVYDHIWEAIKALPAADVRPVVRASWLEGRCTKCCWEMPDTANYGYYDEDWQRTNFCPMCGADMRGVQNNGC